MKLTRKGFISAAGAAAVCGAGAYLAAERRPTSVSEPRTKKGTGMLKGIDPVVSPELLKALAEMGHGDEILFADAHFPGRTNARELIRADGVSVDRVLKGVAPLIELDSYATPVIMTAPVPGDTLDPDVEARIRKALDYKGEIEFVTRDELYARAKRAFAVVQTGETAKYGNVFVKKGVTPVG